MAINDAQIKITADTRQAERAIESLESALAGLERVSSAAAKGLAAITAAGAAVSFAMGKAINAVGQLNDTARALGISAQNLGYLQQSAQLAGIGADELNSSLRRLQSSIGDALIKGTGPASDALNRLGVDLNQVANMDADQQLKLIGEALLAIPNPAERSALAMDLLGKQGPRLLESARAMEEMKRQAEALGLALSDYDVEALDAAGDAIDQLGFLLDGAVKKAAAAVAPYIIAIVDEIKNAIQAAGGFDVILRQIIATIRLAAQAAAVLLTFFAAAKLTAGIIAATTAMLRMYAAIRTATTAAAALNAVLGKNPLLKVAGILLGVGAAKIALDEVNEVFDSLDAKASSVMSDIVVKVDEQKNKTKELVDYANRYNEAQIKALQAFGDTVNKLAQAVQYEKDKLKYGEDEAEIRKIIREEEEKLQKVGLTLTDQQKEMVRMVMSEGHEIKRNNQLRQEQAAIYREMLGAQTALGKEIERLNEMQMTFQGYDKKDIDRMREAAARAFDPSGEKALQNQRIRIQRTIEQELAQYDPLMAAKLKYEKGLDALDDIRMQAQRNNISLTMDQEIAMYNSRLLLDKQYQEDKIKAVEEANRRLQDIEMARIERTLMAERQLLSNVMSENDRALLQRVGQEERQRGIVRDRIEFEKKSEAEKYQFAINQGAQMFSALGAQNKKAFEAAKAFNIANAIMNTYMAATKALATYPPPFSFIAAAAAVGMGLAQVAQIKSQSYSGRALGGPVMGNQSYLVGERGPELFTPGSTGSITRNSDIGGGVTNVNFTIMANDAQGFDDLLLQRRGMITQMIADARLEQGMRAL